MRCLKKLAHKYRALILAYLLLGLAQAFLQSFGSRCFQKVIDHFTDNTLSVGYIAAYGAAMVALYLLSYLDEYPGRRLEHGIMLSLKTEALRKTAVIDYLAYVNIGTGTLVQRIENGAAAGSNILFGFYLRLAGGIIPEMLFSMAFIALISPTVMAAILVGYIAVFLFTNLLLKALYQVKAAILTNEEKLNGLLVRGFMEMVVFRVNLRFAHELCKAEAASEEIVASRVKMTLIHEAFFTVFAVLIVFVKIGIILYGWTAGELTVGGIVALIALVDNAYTPIAICNVLYVQYKLDKVAFARYMEFLDAEEDGHITRGLPAAGVRGGIQFSGLRFSYHGRVIFQGLDYRIAPGKTVAFVGESGAGKSTAAKLLAGLLHPEGGRILIDGVELEKIRLDSYYECLAYLPQEAPVFDGTLRENLVFDGAVEDGFLLEALGKAGLGGLYAKLEQGLDTPLGERGASLSGGERQQLALARLWFSKARIIVLDEATSAMDNLTEEAVMKNVMELLSGRTVISIAHRLDSIQSFDDIAVFQDGRIVEHGTFNELMEKRQYFHELYHRAKA